jgi:hypothetical protein
MLEDEELDWEVGAVVVEEVLGVLLAALPVVLRDAEVLPDDDDDDEDWVVAELVGADDGVVEGTEAEVVGVVLVVEGEVDAETAAVEDGAVGGVTGVGVKDIVA